jgi:hypothetical protein
MSVNKRECRGCGKVADLTSFPSAGIKNNLKYYRRKCQQCYGKNKVHRRVVLRKWMKEYKGHLSCTKCGYSKETHPSFKVQALQFHHTHDNKEHEISNMVHRGFAKETILKEIDKCVVLCSRCHTEAHF